MDKVHKKKTVSVSAKYYSENSDQYSVHNIVKMGYKNIKGTE